MGSHSVLQSQKWSLQCLSQQTQPQWGLLCSDGHTLPQESAPLQPPFPSLALKQSEKNQTKKTPKAEALPYFQQKEESITQGNLHCRPWLCRSLHCSRCWGHTPVGLRPTAAREDRSWGPPHLSGLSCPRHCHVMGNHTQFSGLAARIQCCPPSPSTLAHLGAFAFGVGSEHSQLC